MKKARLLQAKKSKSKIILSLTLIAFFILFLLISFFYKILTLEKFIYVNKSTDGGAEIIVFDPDNEKTIKFKIDADTELDSARGYGNYKLSSIWQLSEKDEIKGRLVTETINKNYLLPTYLWKNGSISNLSIYQKIKAYFLDKRRISVEETFSSQKLSNSVLINFVDTDLLESMPRIQVNDLTGGQRTVEKLSKIIEIIGGKITSNTKGYDESLDCEVSGKQVDYVLIFSKVFGCDIKKTDTETADVVISLGLKFSERF